jgi:hypothetical protein
VFKTPSLLRDLNRTGKKAFQVLRMKGTILVGSSDVASSIGDEPTHMVDCKGCCKGLRVDVFSPKIKCTLNLISLHSSRFQ